jgi:Flp pilus assembly protein TadG
MIPGKRLSRRAYPRWLRADDGAALIEMAVTLPVLFTLMFCFMEMCLAFYTVDMISETAREGTRYAMYRGASCPTSTNPTCEASASQVNSYVSGIGWPNLAGGTITVTTTYPNGNENVGSTVQVKVSYTMPITMPFVPKSSQSFSSTSVMPILQ